MSVIYSKKTEEKKLLEEYVLLPLQPASLILKCFKFQSKIEKLEKKSLDFDSFHFFEKKIEFLVGKTHG